MPSAMMIDPNTIAKAMLPSCVIFLLIENFVMTSITKIASIKTTKPKSAYINVEPICSMFSPKFYFPELQPPLYPER